MSAPPFPVEELRIFLGALIRWALWQPPGEAVSGAFELGDFKERSEDDG